MTPGWITIGAAIVGSSALATLISEIFRSKREKKGKKSGVEHALQLLMYSDIRRRCKEAIDKGSIDPEDLEVLTIQWDCYHNELGGNGYLDKLMNNVDKLPIITEE